MRPLSFLLVFLYVTGLLSAETLKLEVSELEPVRCDKGEKVLVADFGADAYGSLLIEATAVSEATELTVRLGEKLAADGRVDRKPGGSVNFREEKLLLSPGTTSYRLVLAPKPFHLNQKKGLSVQMPAEIGEVTPFRYAELESASALPGNLVLRRTFVHAPFDDAASSFESSDETLNAVWKLCKHTMKATSAFGVYIDGERERIPYEADAYINQLSHYACDLDPRVARQTIDWLLKHPTWPTEWSLHMPLMAAADYLATGDLRVAREHYDELKRKLLTDKAREDDLLKAEGIVDWPAAERDGYNDGKPGVANRQQVGPEINTVVNAFYFHALRQMAVLAYALGKKSDAVELEGKASLVRASFNRVFWDKAGGRYLDGEGSSHASLHANFFPLAFGLVPEDRQNSVADFVESRGMACSVYGAQYLLEALFLSGRDRQAVQLMTARTKRSWWHMLELGSTMTLEAWDADYKPNLTWNHAWGAAPANLISRFVLGVRPAAPGYSKISIAPQLGTLSWVKGTVPTAAGPVLVHARRGERFALELQIPTGATADVLLPLLPQGIATLDGKRLVLQKDGASLRIEKLPAGKHLLESW